MGDVHANLPALRAVLDAIAAADLTRGGHMEHQDRSERIRQLAGDAQAVPV